VHRPWTQLWSFPHFLLKYTCKTSWAKTKIYKEITTILVNIVKVIVLRLSIYRVFETRENCVRQGRSKKPAMVGFQKIAHGRKHGKKTRNRVLGRRLKSPKRCWPYDIGGMRIGRQTKNLTLSIGEFVCPPYLLRVPYIYNKFLRIRLFLKHVFGERRFT
jgi:hypothetical protein